MVIKFNKISSNLTTRNQASLVRRELVRELNSGENLEFDFEGVYIISNSFADECFGKLLLEFQLESLKRLTTFKNISPVIKRTIAHSLQQRLDQANMVHV